MAENEEEEHKEPKLSLTSFSFLKSKRIDVEGVEIDPADIAPLEVETFDDEVFYAEADETSGYRNNHIVALSYTQESRPTLQGLVDTCIVKREEESILFEQGMWVEYRSNNMQWKVGIINRVIKQAPDDWDFELNGDPPESAYNIYYNVGYEGLLEKDSIRAPAKGLQFLYGMRPWLWQQFTLLQIEKRLRIDEGHEYDFEELDCEGFASQRFDRWLEAPQNVDFKEHYDAQPEMSRLLLRMHLLTPFVLMDQVTEDSSEWDFDDPDISVYTYLGVLGQGFTISMLTLAIQVLSPLILLYNSMFLSDGDPNPRFDVITEVDEDVVADDGGFLPDTTLEDFCSEENQNPREEGKILIVIVLFVYIATVLPDAMLSFYKTSGGADSTYSKINSLREIIWHQNDDGFFQQLGFKLDRLMNTGYVPLLYAIMLFILLQTPVVLDIILNALAIEFIHEIDEKIANSDWWDEGNRYIKAGTQELIMQSTLRLRILESPKKLCKMFDINFEDYTDALQGSESIWNPSRAAEDEMNPRYMTLKERNFAEVARRAEEKGLQFTVEEYVKVPEQFGYFSKFTYWVGWRKQGVFHRYIDYRTWSIWNKILFLPRIPELKTKESSTRLNTKASIPVNVGKTDLREFLEHILSVMTGMAMLATVWAAFSNRNYSQIPLKILSGILEMLFYFIQLLFPFIVLFGIIFVPLCY